MSGARRRLARRVLSRRVIRVLPSAVVDRIAAGEVVERPASVVKEIVENALDAGAREISVEFAGGGVERIEVADDGCGMQADEALLAFERHATSKIESERDLSEVATFGFRGEALPSIASVSRLTLLTRGRGMASGTRIAIEGGTLAGRGPAGVPEGTRVRVEDLFFNTPARLKFLKTERTESARILEVVRQLALSNHEVSFSVAREGVEARCYESADEQERASQSFPSLELSRLHEGAGGIVVRAYLAGPGSARAGASGLVIIVNGRPVADRTLAGAVAAAHEGILERGRYPQGVVFIEVPHRMVDVNVHPQKREVRFSEPRLVTSVLHGAVSRWARGCPWAHRPVPRAPAHVVAAAEPRSDLLWLASGARPFAAVPGARHEPEPAPPVDREPGPLPGFSSLAVLGQAFGTYIVCEAGEGIVIIDQHAAAERIAFERLRQAWRTGSIPAQLLLVPLRRDLDAARVALFEENEGLVGSLGIAADVSGPESVTIRGLPAPLAGADPALLLDEVLDEIEEARGRIETVVEKVLARMACHASVRAGDSLDAAEGRALLSDLDRVDWADHCPHGRPVWFEIPRSEIERKLGRR